MLTLNININFTLILSPIEVIELITAIIGFCTIVTPILFDNSKKKRKRHKKSKH